MARWPIKMYEYITHEIVDSFNKSISCLFANGVQNAAGGGRSNSTKGAFG